MKHWKVALILFLSFIFQGTILNQISIYGKTPNLILAFVIVFSYLYEERPYAMIWGALFGLFYDICYSQAIGHTGMILALIAFLIYVIDNIAEKENIAVFLTVSFVSIILYNLLECLFLRLAGNPLGIVAMLKGMTIPLFYTLVVSFVIYFICVRIIRKRSRTF